MLGLTIHINFFFFYMHTHKKNIKKIMINKRIVKANIQVDPTWVLLLQDTAIDESRQLGYLVIGSIQLYITLAEDSLARVFTLVETMKKDQHIKPKSRADTLNCWQYKMK